MFLIITQSRNHGDMTQAEFNNKVTVLINKHLSHTTNTAILEKAKDPYVVELKTRERFLANVISALNGYDITTDLLTEEQILYTFELGICAGQSCGV